MAERTIESISASQLPLVILTKMASMLQRRGVEGWSFKGPLQLAAVNRQLRQAVLCNIQQMKRRHMRILMGQTSIYVGGVVVKNELGSSYSQMDCIDALLIYAQANSLRVSLSWDGKLLSRDVNLVRSLPLSLTSLSLDLTVREIGVDSPFDQILKTVASKTNLETLKLDVNCSDHSTAETHLKSSPSVPKNSPFNHLLTLKNLRTLHIGPTNLLSSAQMADLLNRSQSNITHICCQNYYDNRKYHKVFVEALSDVVRSNIVSICCVRLPSRANGANQLPSFNHLPNCSTIHFQHFGSVGRQTFDEFGKGLLDDCCASVGGVCPGRTLECSVELCNWGLIQTGLELGGETQMEYTLDGIVVRFSTASNLRIGHKHCPFSNNPHDDL